MDVPRSRRNTARHISLIGVRFMSWDSNLGSLSMGCASEGCETREEGSVSVLPRGGGGSRAFQNQSSCEAR